MKLEIENLLNDKFNRARNQFVVKLNGNTFFQSYNTIIAKIDKNRNVTVAEDWNHSKTTRKHLYIWLRDIARMTYIASGDDFIKAVKRKEIKIVETLKY